MRIFVIAAVAALAGAAPLQAAPLPATTVTTPADGALIQVRDRGMGHDGMSGMRHGGMHGMRHGGMRGMRHGRGMDGMRHGGRMRNMHGMNHGRM